MDATRLVVQECTWERFKIAEAWHGPADSAVVTRAVNRGRRDIQRAVAAGAQGPLARRLAWICWVSRAVPARDSGLRRLREIPGIERLRSVTICREFATRRLSNRA